MGEPVIIEPIKVDSTRQLMLWRARRVLRQLGWAGVSGLVLVAFAAGYYVTSYAPLQAQVHQQQRLLSMSSAEMRRPDADEEQGNPTRQLDAFYARLRAPDAVPEVVRRLHRGARDSGLTFVRGDYRPARDPSGKLLRYQITLPVRGAYPKVRKFLARALRDEPTLALDGVGFQTERSGGTLETRVQFTLFVRANG